MNSQNDHQLSPAQAYYLKVLGVDLYGLKGDDAQIHEINSSQTHTQAPSQAIGLEEVKRKLQSKTNPQNKPESKSAKKPLAQSTNKPLAQSTNKPLAQSTNKPLAKFENKPQEIPKPSLITSELALKQSQLITDLCVFYGVERLEKLGDDYYQLGPIKWRFVEQVDRASQTRFKLSDNKLISQSIAKLSDAATKQALWRALRDDMVQS